MCFFADSVGRLSSLKIPYKCASSRRILPPLFLVNKLWRVLLETKFIRHVATGEEEEFNELENLS